MKKIVFLLLCIVLIIISIFIFLITSSDTYNQSAEEFFNINNKNDEITASNLNIILESKTAEGGIFGQITRSIKTETITSSCAVIIVTNRTNVKFGYTMWFSIEKKVNNEWLEISNKDINNIDFESVFIMPNKSVEIKLDWSKSYGNLKKREL